jgi:threonine 3-dehydrogenase
MELSKTMKALCKMGPRPGLTLCDVPMPKVSAREILVRVNAATICGTDLHIYNWDNWAQGRIKPPLIVGHEMCGDVVAAGSDVTNVCIGDYIGAESHFVCGYCYNCRTGQPHICKNVKILGVDRPGCFAQYVSVDAGNAWVTDRALPPAVCAAQEPFGNAVHTALTQQLTARNVLITGCGSLGLFAIAIGKAAGASRIFATDTAPARLEMAKTQGADYVFNARETDMVDHILNATNSEGVDVLLEMSGHASALEQGFAALRYGGHAALLGICSQPIREFDLTNAIIFKGASIYGVSGRKMFETWYQTKGLVETGKVDLRPIITDHLPLEEYETAFEKMLSGSALKCALYPNGMDGAW